MSGPAGRVGTWAQVGSGGRALNDIVCLWNITLIFDVWYEADGLVVDHADSVQLDVAP